MLTRNPNSLITILICTDNTKSQIQHRDEIAVHKNTSFVTRTNACTIATDTHKKHDHSSKNSINYRVCGLAISISSIYSGRNTPNTKPNHSCTPGGIGHELALEFLRHGFQVFGTVRSEEAKKTLMSEGVIAIQLEVTSDASILSLRDEISQRVDGKLDILINNVYVLLILC